MITFPSPFTILIVGVNRRNIDLLAQFIEKEGFHAISARSLDEFDCSLSGEEEFQLALVDISGFDQDIWKRCECLRKRDIPLLIISPRMNPALRQESLDHGASEILVKPLIAKELITLIRNFLKEIP